VSTVIDIPTFLSRLDVGSLSQEKAAEYLRALTGLASMIHSWDAEDKLSYIAKVQEVKKHLASFPVTL
jgi:hypothetical protein